MIRTSHAIKLDIADAWLAFAVAKREDDAVASNAALQQLIDLEIELHTVEAARPRPEL